MFRAPRRRLLAGALTLLAVVAAAWAEPAAAPAKPSTQAKYLKLASAGVARSAAWWDGRRHWYRESLSNKDRLATLWGIVHLFEAKNALAIAHPTAGRRAAVRSFARGAERYWNPNLRPVAGYAASPGTLDPHHRTWYDDNGWWGIAFYDAYRATGDTRYLASAKRALLFVDSGWDARRGGIWWDTTHPFKAGESLAGGTLLAAYLYHETHARLYLRMAKKYIKWADADFRGDDGLYDRHEHDDTPMPYVQGPMAAAFAVLCDTTRDKAYCREGEELADRAAKRFPKLDMGPQYDAMYVRAMLELYRYDNNPRWYAIAADAADRADAKARASSGLYMLTWDGLPMSTIGTGAGLLQTHASTTSVLAWMAAAKAP